MEAEQIRTQNVRKLINDYGYETLVAKTGRSQSQISQWATNAKNSRTQKPSNISRASCRMLEKALRLPEGWMDIDHSSHPQKYDASYSRLVPIRGSAKLGESDNYFVDLRYPAGHGDGYIKFPSTDADAYAVKCDGDSMLPRIRHGEFAIIEPNHEALPGDEVLVQDKNGQVMIKIFSRKVDGRVYFESINSFHSPFSLPEEEIESMQYVAGIAKATLKIE